MKLFLSLGLLGFALTFCGLGDRLRSITGGPSNTGSNSSSNSSSKTTPTGPDAETPELTAAQQKIANDAEEVKWESQGITWRLPSGWKTTDMKKESALFSSPDAAFLIPNISVMSSDFPSDASLKATYDSSLQLLQNGRYESVRYVEIDGIKGVEWLEVMPEDKNGPRRHQWIGFRNYQGQNQQLNIMLSTKGSNFDKLRDEFAAIMYTMEIGK